MYMIASKLSVINHLSHYGALKMIGSKGVKTFSSKAERNPDDRRSLDLVAMKNLTGWNSSQLDPGFSDSYFLSRSTELAGSLPKVPLRSKLRICLECASVGVHMLFHQIDTCLRCPIHRTPLTSICTACNEPIARYFYRRLDDFPFTCNFCGHHFWKRSQNPERESVVARLDIVDSYRSWINKLEKILDGKDENRFFLTAPAGVQNLANLHALFPGPRWMENCLFTTNSARVQTRHFPGPITLPDPMSNGDWAQLSRNVIHCNLNVDVNIERAIGRINKHVRHIVKTDGPKLDNWRNGSSGVGRKGESIINTTGACPVRTGYHLWEWWASHFDDLVSQLKRGCGYDSRVSNRFLPAWLEGPGRLIMSNRYCGESAKSCLAACIAWEETIVNDWLTMLIVRACLLRGGVPFDSYDEPILLGGCPVFLLENKNKLVYMRMATTINSSKMMKLEIAQLNGGFLRKAIETPERFEIPFSIISLQQRDKDICLAEAERLKNIFKTRAFSVNT